MFKFLTLREREVENRLDKIESRLAAIEAAALESKLQPDPLLERMAQLRAHRACCGTEHDPAEGKLHGHCVVCGVPWPCEYAGKPL